MPKYRLMVIALTLTAGLSGRAADSKVALPTAELGPENLPSRAGAAELGTVPIVSIGPEAEPHG